MQFDHLRRREFNTLLGSTAAAWPPGARAQQEPVPVVGWLSSYFPDAFVLQLLASFRQGLVAAGYFEDHNVRIEYPGRGPK
jgi:putative ABC transport system substrate-binding protein